VLTGNGQTLNFEVRKVPIFDEQGQRQALVIIGRDITERKQAEREILQAKEIAEHANQPKASFWQI